MMAVSNWAQLYADSLVDVSDIAEEVGKAQGGYFKTARAVANDGKRWIAMPFTILGVLFANRTSWFAEEGITPDKFPEDLGGISRGRQEAEGQRTGRLVRRWPMRSATGRRSGIPICGRGAARRSRPTARPWCSTARRPSSWSNSQSASGRMLSTKAACRGTMPATTAPFSPTRSVRPATAPRSICWRAASPTPT